MLKVTILYNDAKLTSRAGIRIKTVAGTTGQVKDVTFNKITLTNINE